MRARHDDCRRGWWPVQDGRPSGRNLTGQKLIRRVAPGEAGFTLIEVIISLALFALISAAGLALIEAVMRTQEGTAGRLDRIGELQRAVYVVTRDLEQSAAGTLERVEGGVRFRRQSASPVNQGPTLTYILSGDQLVRGIDPTLPTSRSQLLLGGVSSARWTFFYRERGWQENLPFRASQAPTDAAGVGMPVAPGPAAPEPAAIALTLQLAPGAAGPVGTVRRVVELPAPSAGGTQP